MTCVLRRISTGSEMSILVDQADPNDQDKAGFGVAGRFYFASAGEPGDSQTVSDHVAKVIMGDPGLAPHFVIDGGAVAAAGDEPTDSQDSQAGAGEAQPRRRRRTQPADGS